MVFPRSRTIVAKTEDEVDSALNLASRIVVEGDDALLSYAMARVGGDPEASIAAETPPRSVSVSGRVVERAPAGQGRGALRLLGWLLPCLALVFVGFWLFEHYHAASPLSAAQAERPRAPQPSELSASLIARDLAQSTERGIAPIPTPVPVPPPAPAAAPAPISKPATIPETSELDVAAEMDGLAWPLVVIVGILATFLIARQAVASGRDVEISWSVSEKVAGRLVITKVRGRDRVARSTA